MGTFNDDLVIQGTLRVKGGILGSIPRENLATDSLKAFNIPITDLRIWDAFGTPLPTTGTADDLGMVTAAFASGLPYITTSNLAGAGDTWRYARFIAQLPHNYVPGGTAKLRVHVGFNNFTPDVGAQVDFQAYLSNREVNSLITGSDLVSTGAQTVTGGAFSNKDFSLTSTRLVPGAYIDCRIGLNVNDAVDTGEVTMEFTNLELICDVQG